MPYDYSEDDPTTGPGLDEERPLSVSQLTMCIKQLVEGSLPQVWLEGEISDLSRPSSGHYYLTLKDKNCQIRAVMWRTAAARLPFQLEDGQAIVCQGGVEVYPPRGTYQLVIQRVQPKGIGSLQLAFQQLHKRLSAEGLFDAVRKRPLPRFPERVGFVTSPSGAAVHDFLEAARRRWPLMKLLVIPAKVQGAGAAEDIVRGIQMAARVRPKLDVLVVGRGGGSLEDLWCFNDERVVRALIASPMPTVSAVGHEVDVTLSDLAADVRALTPTHAAEVALPKAAEIAGFLSQARMRLTTTLHSRLRHARERLDQLGRSRALAAPHELINMRRQLVDEWEMRGRAAMWQGLRNHEARMQGLARAAHALSPLQVLSRGYSLTSRTQDGRLLHDASEVVIGDQITTVLQHGSVQSQVVAVNGRNVLDPPPTDSPTHVRESKESTSVKRKTIKTRP
ncbi:MAG: exodeoxyribonuclease VII large subunit [Pirellulaceae bacterium]|nr:exodeoxyribonuclease VII large subunit [Pirellulaceae bacterium]